MSKILDLIQWLLFVVSVALLLYGHIKEGIILLVIDLVIGVARSKW